MNANEFIKLHIKIDERERLNRKINILSEKYISFGNHLKLIQKECVGLLFSILKKENFFFKGMIIDDLKLWEYNYYVNLLLAENFIEVFEPDENILSTISSTYNNYVANKINYYRLSNKGRDFLNIDYIDKYLSEEYSDKINEMKSQ